MQTQQCDRTGWPPGPWDQEPDRAEWTYRDLPCLARRAPFGAWCGYVAVPKGHPLYGVPYDVVANTVEVHGGLTYSNNCHCDICHAAGGDVWWFGFDCAHAFDVSPGLDVFLLRNGATPGAIMSTYRDLDFVKAEVQALADQLHDVG